MFQAITIKSKETSGQQIDIGFLAECLLFYENINLLGDKNTLPELFDLCGINEVRELIKNGRLNLFVREDIIGASSFGNDLFDLQTWKSDAIKQEKILNETFESLIGKSNESNKLTQEFMELTKPFEYNDGILEEIKSDLQDKDYISKAISSCINFWNPNKKINPQEIQAQYFESGQFGPFTTYKFETNINLEEFKDVNASSVILNIAEARGDIHIASHFNSEIADKPIYSSLIRDRINTLINKFEKNEQGISSFQEIILPDYKPIGGSIRNNEIQFRDFIKLLEKSEKFRDWLQKVDDDKNVISEYHKAVISETWADKLPSKGVRFLVFTGAGLATDALLTGGLGTGIGIALGAGDNFIVDKLIKGWKPNQFIDDELSKILRKK